MLQLLTRLRRKGATVRPCGASTEPSWLIVSPGDIRRKANEGFPVDARIVAYARDQGWITTDGDGAGLRLTEAGALKVARGLDLTAAEAKPAQTAEALPARSIGRKRETSRSEAAPSAVTRLRRQRDAHGRPLIAGAAKEAAERLAGDFMRGQMMPRVTADWDKAILGQRPAGMAPGLGTELRDMTADAQERVRRALYHVGRDHAGVLIDVCCLDRGLADVEVSRSWPRGAGRIVLGIALNMLAAHYGIVASGPERGRIDRWGRGDDRPTLDDWR